VSGRRPWLQFARRGGLPPRDDESLRLSEGGSFSGRRTIGGLRIGTFEGRLPGTTLASLQALVDALPPAAELRLPTPQHGATETIDVAGRTLEIGSNDAPPKPWRALIEDVRRLMTDEVVESPRAAVELVAGARSAQLVHAGSAPIEVDLGSVTVRLIRVDGDGAVVGRWSGRPTGELVDNGERLVPATRWVTASAGWSAPLPFDTSLKPDTGEWLQVWVTATIRNGADARDGQLYAPVKGGG